MVTTAQIPCPVDSIIFGSSEESLNLLPLKRTFEPARGERPAGGRICAGKWKRRQCRKRMLNELTGFEACSLMERAGIFGGIYRGLGERGVVVATMPWPIPTNMAAISCSNTTPIG